MSPNQTNLSHSKPIPIEIDQPFGNASGYVIDSAAEQTKHYLSEYLPEANAVADWLKKNVAHTAILKNLNVNEDQRGNGHGNELLHRFVDEAGACFAEAVILISDHAESQNEGFNLNRWYEGFDFVPVKNTGAGPFMVYPSELGERMKAALFPDASKQAVAELNTDPHVIEDRVMAEYLRVVGKTVLINAISGFVGNDSVDINLDPPAKVRVDPTRRESVLHWNDDWLDPYWEVTLLEPHPALTDVRSIWIHGPCHHLDGVQTEAGDVVSIVDDPSLDNAQSPGI